MRDDDSGPSEHNGTDLRGAGARLRAARESQGLRIDTAAQALGLAAGVVAKLEADEYGSLGAPVYVRGYLRKYARYLDLPEDELVAAYETVSTPRDPELKSPLSPNLEHHGSKRLLTVVAVVLLLIVIAVAAIWAWRYVRRGQETARIPPSAAASAAPAFSGATMVGLTPPATHKQGLFATNAQTSLRGKSVNIVPPSLPGTGAIAASASGSESAAPQSSADKLVLHVHDTSWIEIMAADHTRLYYDLAPAGSTLDFDARHGALTIFLGNAPGVDVVVNGRAYAIPKTDRSGNTARFKVKLNQSSAAHRS